MASFIAIPLDLLIAYHLCDPGAGAVGVRKDPRPTDVNGITDGAVALLVELFLPQLQSAVQVVEVMLGLGDVAGKAGGCVARPLLRDEIGKLQVLAVD